MLVFVTARNSRVVPEAASNEVIGGGGGGGGVWGEVGRPGIVLSVPGW